MDGGHGAARPSPPLPTRSPLLTGTADNSHGGGEQPRRGRAGRHQHVNNADLGPGTLQAGNGTERSCCPTKVTQPSSPEVHDGLGPVKALSATDWRWLGKVEGVQEGPLRPPTQLPERTLSSLRLSTCHPSAALNSPPAREQGLPQIPGSRA